MLAAIENGYVQREIHEAAYRYQKEVESGETQVVGVNTYVEDEAEAGNIFQPDPSVEARRAERLKKFREDRDDAAATGALAALAKGAAGEANLMPLAIEAVQSRATLGEISDCLREVFGVYEPVNTF